LRASVLTHAHAVADDLGPHRVARLRAPLDGHGAMPPERLVSKEARDD
jgi:hypothetical protein